MPDWCFTQHALGRMQQRSVDRSRVLEVLRDPEVTHPTFNSLRRACQGDLTIVFDPESRVVVTVMWRLPLAEAC